MDNENEDVLQTYFNENKEKDFSEWLSFRETFKKKGKQGFVGILDTKKLENQEYVFKISQYINHLVNHEFSVMNSLNSLVEFCPNFCKSYGLFYTNINPSQEKNGNPFSDTKIPIQKGVLLIKNIKNSRKFYSVIKDENVSNTIIYSIIKQVLLAISIAQMKNNFTHYDLHSNNILIKTCYKDIVFLYIVDDSNAFCIPSNGFYPVIIDYGFSYCKDVENNPAWSSYCHTEAGFTSDRYDNIVDPRLFLITTSADIKEYRKNNRCKTFYNLVKNIFYKLEPCWDSGWVEYVSKSASDYTLDRILRYGKKSKLFTNYTYLFFDILQTLVILPLEKQSHTNLKESFTAFIDEFSKIEDFIAQSKSCFYILKTIVDCARLEIPYYLKGKTRKESIARFKRNVLDRIDSIARFCNVKLNFDLLLCTLVCIARGIEGLLYEHMEKYTNRRNKKYEKLRLKNALHIYSALEVNLPSPYIFTKKTRVLVIDSINEEYTGLKLSPTEIEKVNTIHPLERGSFLKTIKDNI